MGRAARILSWLVLALAAYLTFLLARYFYAPHLPRFRVETICMWFVALGVLCVVLREPASPSVQQAAAPAPPPRWFWPMLTVGFVAAAFALYRTALEVGFLSDDFVLAEWAARRDWVHRETGFVRPVVPMLWALLSLMPLPLEISAHAVNVLLHAVNARFIADLAAGLGASRGEAVGAGVLFLTFPGLTEAIVWASGMQDVLMTSLALAAIVAVVRMDGAGSLPWFPPVAASVVALGVKETAIAVPVLGWLAWSSLSGERRRARLALGVMTGAALAYAAYRTLGGMPSGYATAIDQYFIKQLIVEPFATLGEPWSTVWMRAHPTAALARGSLLILLVVAGFWFWNRRDPAFRRATMLSAWVLVAVLPVFSYFHVSATLEGSRYLYLPAAGFSIVLAGLIADAARRLTPQRATGAAALVVALMAIQSVMVVRTETARWTEAARLRDAILESLLNAPAAERCDSMIAEGAVDNVEGAYVLRNGIRQAMAGRRGLELPTAPGVMQCVVNWTDRLEVRELP
jgi:hypothetical protein